MGFDYEKDLGNYWSGLGDLEACGGSIHFGGMDHVDMRKLPAAAQEERRRPVVGLRESGLTYEAIAAQVGLTRTGVFNICRRFAEQGLPGLASGPRGPAPGTGRYLTAGQEALIRALIRQHTPDELGLPFALWSRAAVRELIDTQSAPIGRPSKTPPNEARTRR